MRVCRVASATETWGKRHAPSTALTLLLATALRAGYVFGETGAQIGVGWAAGLAALTVSHTALFKGIQAMMLTPTQRMRQAKKLSVQVEAHRPPPPRMTPSLLWRMLGPSATASSFRQFARLYGHRLFFHWVAFSLSLMAGAAAQAYAEGAGMGRRLSQGEISERERQRLVYEADLALREFQARSTASVAGTVPPPATPSATR